MCENIVHILFNALLTSAVRKEEKKDNKLLGSQVLVRYWHEEITIKCKILFNIIGDVIITEDSMHSFFGACLQLTRLEVLVRECC